VGHPARPGRADGDDEDRRRFVWSLGGRTPPGQPGDDGEGDLPAAKGGVRLRLLWSDGTVDMVEPGTRRELLPQEREVLRRVSGRGQVRVPIRTCRTLRPYALSATRPCARRLSALPATLPGWDLTQIHTTHNPDACYCACGTGGPCEHRWDGEPVEEGGLWTTTCSRCGDVGVQSFVEDWGMSTRLCAGCTHPTILSHPRLRGRGTPRHPRGRAELGRARCGRHPGLAHCQRGG
jgi:hypothetical protein